VIEKYFNRNYSEEMKVKIDTPEGRDIYSRRMGIIEPVFGNIKNAKRLNRFTLRTKGKVNKVSGKMWTKQVEKIESVSYNK